MIRRYLAQPEHGLPKKPLADAVLAEDLLDPPNHLVRVQMREVVKLKPLLLLLAAITRPTRTLTKRITITRPILTFTCCCVIQGRITTSIITKAITITITTTTTTSTKKQ